MNLRNKKSKMMISLAAIFIVVFLGFLTIYRRNISQPASTKSEKVVFEVKEGEGVRNITKSLSEKALLQHPTTFIIFLKLNGLTSDIKAGVYQLDKNMDIVKLADILAGGKVQTLKITIPEGWDDTQIADQLEKKGIIKKDDFLKAAKANYDYEFLKSKPAGSSAEGYLYPDTYFFSTNVSGDAVVNKMLDNFDKKYSSKLALEAKKQGFTTHEIITLASIVEKEASNSEDRALIAGILKKRLKIGMPLQSDVTVNYLVGDWKKELTAADLNIDSPYNTRKYKGLPPGPIDNPGLDSIQTALYSKDSDYLFYLSSKDGKTYYSVTQQEHEEKKAKYLQ